MRNYFLNTNERKSTWFPNRSLRMKRAALSESFWDAGFRLPYPLRRKNRTVTGAAHGV
jgi:hypothetical protein